MSHLKFALTVALAAFFIVTTARAQNVGTVSNHAVVIGKGASATGFNGIPPGTSGLPLISQGTAADPIFGALGNSGLATMPANTVKCNSTGSTSAAADCTNPSILGLTISPTASTANTGLAITNASPSGTAVAGNIPDYALAGSYALNSIAVTGDNIALATSGAILSAFAITHKFGGANLTGGRSALGVTATLTATDSPSNTAAYWVAGQFYTSSAVNNGGTGLTAATSRGGLWATNPFVVTFSGATNYNQVVSEEVNISARAGSSMYYKAGISITADASDAVQGAVFDAELSLTNASGAVGWKNGILFSNGNGQQPISASGCLICASVPATTIATGIDISQYSFSGFALKTSGGFAIDGLGNITQSAHIVNGSGAAPVLSACGTSPTIAGTDFAGKITTGAGATACTLTFRNAYTAQPSCVVQGYGVANPSFSSITNAAFTITTGASNVYTYVCVAVPGG